MRRHLFTECLFTFGDEVYSCSTFGSVDCTVAHSHSHWLSDNGWEHTYYEQ